MDYDHAKKTSSKVEMKSQLAGLSPSDIEEDRHLLRSNLNRIFGAKVADDVLDTAMKWFMPLNAAQYIHGVAKALELSNLASGNTLTTEDLRWFNVEDKTQSLFWPDFENSKAGPGERTGTLPFMSGEVIARESLHTPLGYDETPPFVHQAIHDVESLLWVFVHLCLTRKGPGSNMRREELDKGSQSYNQKLFEIVVELFDGSEEQLKEKKKYFHKSWRLFEKEIVEHFHPDFNPLKPHVCKWWKTLILGYKYRGEEFYNIHTYIRRIIDEAIKDIDIPDYTDDDSAKQTELDRRKSCKERRLGTFLSPVSRSSSESSMKTPPQRHSQLSQDDQDSPLAAFSPRKRQKM